MTDISQHQSEIEAALAYASDTYTFEDVRREVSEGKLQYWPGVRSAVVTQIAEYPRRKTLVIFLAGGSLAEIEAMTPGILAWGREQGCSTASFAGRRGWERTFLTRTGWLPKLVVFETHLDG